MTAELIKCAKRGANKTLSFDLWTSASIEPDTKALLSFHINFTADDTVMRYRVRLDRDAARKLHERLSVYFPPRELE